MGRIVDRRIFQDSLALMKLKGDAQTSRVQALLPYVDYLSRRHKGVHELLMRHQLDRYDLGAPLSHIPTRALLAFSYDAAAALNDHQLGLHLASASKPEDTVCAGLFMSYANSVREALLLMTHAIDPSQNCAMHSITPKRDRFGFVFRYERLDADLARYEMERWASTIVKLIRLRMGHGWAPVEIHFEHAIKGPLSTYEQHFGSPVFFEQSVNQIIINSHDLDLQSNMQPNALTTYFREHLLEDYVNNLRCDTQRPQSLAARVGLVVSQRLAEGNYALPVVASELNMSTRSLQRHLVMEGTNFQSIVRQQRHRIAMTLLAGDKPLTTAAIAASVGYADRTTLSQAFKSWTGVSPKRYSKAIG